MALKILNNIDHKDLKIDVRPGRRYGDYANRVAVLSTEYSDLHKQFPIVIYKNGESKQLASHAILGFEKDENLFIENNEWQTQYVPAMLARGPFSIGYRRREQDGKESTETLIMVDEDDPRCAVHEGEAPFLEFGGESPYLQYIKKVLKAIEVGQQVDKVFFSLLQELDLLEPVSIRITLTAEQAVNFQGYHTISRDRLAKLDGYSLQKLNDAGVLGLVFFAISSLDNFEKMIALKNARAASS
ncbi:MAG: SapC family protein [Gammaproteobacteria bacterium]|nr:SapC family protein [Gammaproteobacteria bacterium]MDH5305017.1 SapC family protein [Gammaproteobacteria bacterium]MDH5322916.1 SapC family protein [Gammaproteobacteria bacterium]